MNNNTQAGYGRRLLAYLFDWYLSSILASLPAIFLLKQDTFQPIVSLQGASFWMACILCMSGLLIAFCYYIYFPYYWKGHRGQTLGKRIFHIKVASQNQGEVTLGMLVKREALGITLLEGGLVTSSGFLRELVQLFVQVPIISYWLAVSWIITFLSILLACFTPSKRMLHDYVAHTVVLKQN